MTPKQTDVSVAYVFWLAWTASKNNFGNLPDDIKHLLENEESTIRGIVDQLYLDQHYKITIHIQSIGLT